mmetsp:Transcript_37317/g.69509  ORF Transcript_37317/g.69509 Transcript_37317/m.69509 type:complete len:626 (+) Transcript_37317:90-1967(+)
MGGIVSFFPDKKENLPPILLVPFEKFSKAGCFLRYPNHHKETVDLDTIDISESFIVFISHHWLRSDKNDPGYDITPHPDNVNNDKYKLCVSGIQQLLSNFIDQTRIKNCYVWIDYSCIDQDLHNLISVDYKNMEEIIRVSDCIFTPVVDPDNSFKHLTITPDGFIKDYKVLDWTGSEYSNRGYLKRGWCLLEMFYGMNIPLAERYLPREVYAGPKSKSRKFRRRLRLDADSGRRTHFLYGPREKSLGVCPIAIFPFFTNGLLYHYHPLNSAFTDPDDIYKLEFLMNNLLPHMSVTPQESKIDEFSYTGEMTELGQPIGEGRYLYNDGSEYSGGWLNGYYEGYGQLTLANNAGGYKGNFKNDLRNGHGKQVDSDGSVYTGEWLDGAMWGTGTKVYPSSAAYTGEWVKNKRHGKGKFSDSDGSVYEGDYILDFRHGEGKYVSKPVTKDGKTFSYEGRWREDMFDGLGTYNYEDGTSYVGRFSHNQKHRFGRQTFLDGSVYEGNFLKDKFHGEGTLTYASGGVYTGAWIEGRMQGEGTFTSPDGEEYTGNWVDDKKYGMGKMTYPSGAVYEGEWLNDMRHGDGTYWGADGTSYKGRFIKGLKHGYGTFRYEDGTTLEGRWIEGKSTLA